MVGHPTSTGRAFVSYALDPGLWRAVSWTVGIMAPSRLERPSMPWWNELLGRVLLWLRPGAAISLVWSFRGPCVIQRAQEVPKQADNPVEHEGCNRKDH